MKLRYLAVVGLAVVGMVGAAGPASAFDCNNPNKAAGSGGTIGTYNVATDTFTPSGAPGNPVFVEILLPTGTSTFLFVHAAKGVGGVVPGAKGCDGKGLDNFEACMGV